MVQHNQKHGGISEKVSRILQHHENGMVQVTLKEQRDIVLRCEPELGIADVFDALTLTEFTENALCPMTLQNS